MIEDILKNNSFRRYFPPVAGIVFIGVFIALGFWQLDRAAQKKASLAQFADATPYMPLNGQHPERPFQPVEARGRFADERQILIENIVRNGQVGYFVITPFQQPGDEALLLVNRGWLARVGQETGRTPIDVSDDVRTIHGRAGRLPQVSIRAGDGFAGAGDWPKSATYPTLDEIAAELEADVAPFVMLLAPEDPDGFNRQWQPQQSGPMTNYGYAFQWFAMAVAVFAILLWRFRNVVRGR